ncbi:MAG: SH3 domain-containing protein [Clostridia bacterium]|nr:SH3 domain-containing protein [Clostridia bacterium]
MNKRIIRVLCLLLVTATCVSVCPAFTPLTAYALELKNGDINGDGEITTKDALLTMRYVAKLESLTDAQVEVADFDKNGSIDLEDARAILRYVTLGEGYEDSLYNAGFPASYVELLLDLHKKYPDWEFKAMKTGLNWADAVNGEHTPHNKQLIEKNVDASLKCNCSKCDGVIQEASSWVSASKTAIEYYLDPRNFLNEQYIFQFESTAYSENQTKAGVEAILDGTWMENSYITYYDALGNSKTYLNSKGNKVKYSDAIMQAAKDSGMSAYYLASKIVQEVGSSKASYAGGSCGTNAPYNGIYNYYNIGAYTGAVDGLEWANGYLNTKRATAKLLKEPTADAEVIVTIPQNSSSIYYISEKDGYYYVSTVVSGKSYKGYVLKSSVNPTTTYGRPWSNPYKSIYYGAQYIYASFSKYQYTGYLQKFNVNKESGSLYSHEYMANVRAAASEAKHTYNAYVDAGILSTAKTFVIPVFNNMPNADMTRDDAFKASRPTVKCTSCNTTSINLVWTEVKNASGYQIYKLDESGKSVKIATVGADTLTYKDTIGTPATKVTYRVRAYTTAKDGTTIVSKYHQFDASTSTAPPTNLKLTGVTDESVSLSWTGVDNCDGYRIYRYDAISGSYAPIGKTSETKFTDTTALSGTSYKYKVCAYIYYTQHFQSSYTNEITAKTTGEAATQLGKVNVDDVLNMRAEPSTSGTVIIQLKAGSQVYIIKREGEWYKVRAVLDGTTYTGYVHTDYIIITNSDLTREQCPYAEPTATLRSGSTGDGVKWIQWHLYKLGYLKQTDIDGDFGPTTLAAVKKYQTDKKLDVDGVVGSGTRSQLKIDYNNS